MNVEEKVREAMNAYADTIDPQGSYERIADRGPGLRWMRFAPVAIAMAAVATLIAIQVIPHHSPTVSVGPADPGSPALDATFTSSSGHWRFDYPKEWSLLEENPDAGFAGTRLPTRDWDGSLGDGRVLVRWVSVSSPVPPTGDKRPKTIQELEDFFCAPARGNLSCATVEINGRTWVEWLARVQREDQKVLQMSTTLDGRPFRVSAWVGDGAQQDDLLKLVGRVFDTFVIR